MSATQDAWKDVASRAESIGLKLKFHLAQENDDTNDDKQPGDTDKAMKDLNQRIQDAFDAMGSAAKDPAVHADFREMGTSLFNALSLTFNSVGAKISDATRDASGKADDGGDGPDDGTDLPQPGEIEDVTTEDITIQETTTQDPTPKDPNTEE